MSRLSSYAKPQENQSGMEDARVGIEAKVAILYGPRAVSDGDEGC